MLGKRSSFRGFTVLELLVVIAMITIVLAIAVVNFSRAKSHVGDDGRVAMMQLLVLGLQQYHSQCKVYPESLDPATQNAYPVGANQQICLLTFGDVLDPSVDTSIFEYVPLRAPTVSSGACNAFHLAVQLEEGGGTRLLSEDSDWQGDPQSVGCIGGSSHASFDDGDAFYDIRFP